MAAGGISVSRGDDAGGGASWSAACGPAHPGLGGVVAGRYTGYVERTAAPLRRREAATGQVSLIISFGDPLDIVEMPLSAAGARRWATPPGARARSTGTGRRDPTPP